MARWFTARAMAARFLRRIAIVAVLGAVGAGPALALDCPVPQPLTRPGILQETPAQIAALSTLLASGDLGNTIPVIVADLRARYPGVENAEIINYLMAGYCPVVAQLSGLSDQQKQEKMVQFTRQLVQVIY